MFCCTIDVVGRELPQGAVRFEVARRALLRLAAADQIDRSQFVVPSSETTEDDWLRADHERADQLLQLLDTCGEFSSTTVGADGCRAAWLIALHAGDYRRCRAVVLSMMERLRRSDPAVTFGAGIPYLVDAASLDAQEHAAGARTRFGTIPYITRYGPEGPEVIPFGVEDEAGLDARRAAYDLAPLDEPCPHLRTASDDASRHT